MTMENNLPKFASTNVDGEDEKSSIGAHMDDMDSSDAEIEPDHV